MSDVPLSGPADDASLVSPGELLRRERDAQGLSISEVAGTLNLRPAVIQSLEADRYDEIPVATYRRGYLRAYARLLGVDEGLIFDAYRARFGSDDAEQRVTPVQVQRPPMRLGAWLFRLATLLVIAGLVGSTLLWWQSRGGSEPPIVGDSDPVAVDRLNGTPSLPDPMPGSQESDSAFTDLPPLPAADAPPAPPSRVDADSARALFDAAAEDAIDPSEAATDPGLEEGAVEDLAGGLEEGAGASPEAGTTEAGSAESPADSEESAAAEAPAADPRRLELTFNEQSWTEIFDANNQRIFVGLQEPGTTASVEGDPPFRFVVGNASSVELTWAGEAVDLPARTGANNVARFTLGD